MPPQLGGGIQAYFEGFHYIHCLVSYLESCNHLSSPKSINRLLACFAQNMVRQYTYRHEYDYSHVHAFHIPNIRALEHVEHCLEMLRARIQCDGEIALYPVTRAEPRENGSGYPVEKNKKRLTIRSERPKRRCRNFSKLVAWANSHLTIPLETSMDA